MTISLFARPVPVVREHTVISPLVSRVSPREVNLQFAYPLRQAKPRDRKRCTAVAAYKKRRGTAAPLPKEQAESMTGETRTGVREKALLSLVEKKNGAAVERLIRSTHGPIPLSDIKRLLRARGRESDADAAFHLLCAMAHNDSTALATSWQERSADLPAPDQECYLIVLHACCLCGQVQRCRDVMGLMSRAGFPFDAHAFSLLARAWANYAGGVPSTEFHGVAGDVPSVDPSYAAAETGTEPHLELQVSSIYSIIREMERRGVKPDARVYCPLMSLYNGKGLPGKAREVFEEMQAAGVRPDRLAWMMRVDADWMSGPSQAALATFREALASRKLRVPLSLRHLGGAGARTSRPGQGQKFSGTRGGDSIPTGGDSIPTGGDSIPTGGRAGSIGSETELGALQDDIGGQDNSQVIGGSERISGGPLGKEAHVATDGSINHIALDCSINRRSTRAAAATEATTTSTTATATAISSTRTRTNSSVDTKSSSSSSNSNTNSNSNSTTSMGVDSTAPDAALVLDLHGFTPLAGRVCLLHVLGELQCQWHAGTLATLDLHVVVGRGRHSQVRWESPLQTQVSQQLQELRPRLDIKFLRGNQGCFVVKHAQLKCWLAGMAFA